MVGTTRRLVEAGFQGGGDPRWRLRGQLQMQAIEQQLLVGLRLGVAAQDQGSSVGGGQMDIDHLDGGEFLQGGARGQARCEGPQTGLQGDLQAIGQEGHKDMRFDPRIQLVVDGTNTQVALELFERLFDFGELDQALLACSARMLGRCNGF